MIFGPVGRLRPPWEWRSCLPTVFHASDVFSGSKFIKPLIEINYRLLKAEQMAPNLKYEMGFDHETYVVHRSTNDMIIFDAEFKLDPASREVASSNSTARLTTAA